MAKAFNPQRRAVATPRLTGVILAVLGVILWGAGANSSSPWVVALASALLTAPLSSLIAIRRAATRVDLHASGPNRFVAGQPSPINVRLEEAPAAWLCGLIVVRDADDQPLGAVHPSDPHPATVFLSLDRGPVQAVALRLQIEDRLGLARAVVDRRPAITGLTQPSGRATPETSRLPDGVRAQASARSQLQRMGDEVAGTRPFQQGDSIRHVDWRAMARRTELMAMEISSSGADEIRLGIAGGTWTREALDRACDSVTATANELQAGGRHVVLSVDGDQIAWGPAARDRLALLPPNSTDRPRPLADEGEVDLLFTPSGVRMNTSTASAGR